MRNTKWVFKSENFERRNENIDKEIEQILHNRGIESRDEIEFFINGTLPILESTTL